VGRDDLLSSAEVGQAKWLVDQGAKPEPDQDGMTSNVEWKEIAKKKHIYTLLQG
jgi:hypothetical protein